MIGYFILSGIIVFQIFVIGILLDGWETERKENERHYNKLRREYDIRIEELKKDLDVRDDIINGYKGVN